MATYKSVMEMVWNMDCSILFKLRFTLKIFVKRIKEKFYE